MKNEKGFTLIELLAVVIILGVLMIIAIPSVTKYINDTRKNSYVSTIKNIVSGVRNSLYSGSLNLNDKNTTYYIDGKCVKTENGYKSPYGEFEEAYVVVTITDDGYNYYWTSVDKEGFGVKSLIDVDDLDSDDIENNIKTSDITTNRGIDRRSKIIVVDDNCQKGSPIDANIRINGQTGEVVTLACKKATVLHTATCERSDGIGCNAIYDANSTITYGTIPNGQPKSGDAYDCKVSMSSGYTERFYYITSEDDNSLLLYYKNIGDQTPYKYDTVDENWHGPREGIKHLPSANEWNNPNLIAPGTRQITTSSNKTATKGGTIELFTYEGVTSRFINSFDITAACGAQPAVTGYFDKCNYFMENIGMYEKGSGILGYWLETPITNSTFTIFLAYGSDRKTATGNASNPSSVGVRPLITIKTSFIEQ